MVEKQGELRIRWQYADAADARHTESPSLGAGPSSNGRAGCELFIGGETEGQINGNERGYQVPWFAMLSV